MRTTLLLVLFLLLLQWLYGGGSTLNPFSSSLFSRRRDDSQASSSSRSGNWRSRFGSLTRSLDYPIPIGETQMSAARMEFLLELMRLQRWVGTAYLVARAVDRLVDGLKTLTSSALVGNSKSDGSSHKVSCPQAVLESCYANEICPSTNLTMLSELFLLLLLVFQAATPATTGPSSVDCTH
jgi:hypothetical protein